MSLVKWLQVHEFEQLFEKEEIKDFEGRSIEFLWKDFGYWSFYLSPLYVFEDRAFQNKTFRDCYFTFPASLLYTSEFCILKVERKFRSERWGLFGKIEEFHLDDPSNWEKKMFSREKLEADLEPLFKSLEKFIGLPTDIAKIGLRSYCYLWNNGDLPNIRQIFQILYDSDNDSDKATFVDSYPSFRRY